MSLMHRDIKENNIKVGSFLEKAGERVRSKGGSYNDWMNLTSLDLTFAEQWYKQTQYRAKYYKYRQLLRTRLRINYGYDETVADYLLNRGINTFRWFDRKLELMFEAFLLSNRLAEGLITYDDEIALYAIEEELSHLLLPGEKFYSYVSSKPIIIDVDLAKFKFIKSIVLQFFKRLRSTVSRDIRRLLRCIIRFNFHRLDEEGHSLNFLVATGNSFYNKIKPPSRWKNINSLYLNRYLLPC